MISIRNQNVRLTDIVSPDGPPILRGYTFDDCVIDGPAVISLRDNVTLDTCGWDGGKDSLFIPIEAGRIVIGVIGIEDCVFRTCRFRRVGIAGIAADIARLRQEMGEAIL